MGKGGGRRAREVREGEGRWERGKGGRRGDGVGWERGREGEVMYQ